MSETKTHRSAEARKRSSSTGKPIQADKLTKGLFSLVTQQGISELQSGKEPVDTRRPPFTTGLFVASKQKSFLSTLSPLFGGRHLSKRLSETAGNCESQRGLAYVLCGLNRRIGNGIPRRRRHDTQQEGKEPGLAIVLESSVSTDALGAPPLALQSPHGRPLPRRLRTGAKRRYRRRPRRSTPPSQPLATTRPATQLSRTGDGAGNRSIALAIVHDSEALRPPRRRMSRTSTLPSKYPALEIHPCNPRERHDRRTRSALQRFSI